MNPPSAVTSVSSGGRATAAMLEALQARYARRRPNSRELHEASRSLLPGGNSRTPLFHPPFPCYLDAGHGARVIDVDGFEYIDMVNNYTSLVHGHPTPELTEELAHRAANGTALGAPTPLEVELAREIVERVPSLQRVRFANSGTEATLYAVRTARAFTGRDDVIKVEGGYHGGAESLQFSVKTLGAANEAAPEPGAPESMRHSTHIVPFNDAATAKRLILEHGASAAAVIVEPVQGGAGALPATKAYLQALREAATQTGCLLIFDEVMTLRLAYGGMQEEYGVLPDLTAMGKIIGGGLPVGAFGGRADVMDLWDPGAAQPAYHAGTFNANPLTAVAGLYTLRKLTRAAIAGLNESGDRLRDRFNVLARKARVPLVASGWGSVLQVHHGESPPASFRDAVSRPRDLVRAFHLLMLEHGVFIAPRGAMNVSTAMTDADHAAIEQACARSLGDISRAGAATS